MQEWIINTMTSLGYVGIALLMFAENLFPPIPSELIMPLAGFTVAQGNMNFTIAVLAGVVGTVVGAFPWYYAGVFVGEERLKKLADKYGKWITVSGKDIDKANNWFNRYGKKAVFFGRLVPGIRTLISLPAGLNEMALGTFLIYSTLGTTLWVMFLTFLGFILKDSYELVDEYLGPISKFVLLALIIAFGVWVWQKRKKSKRNRS
ncbi:MAG TPA: alkaline phosphatase [Cyanobacteria bacterium UBA11149]|nr:alkaline phosphatase [Cyanobacteria bacterium UBA11367]HBE58775.1 alkaline phosphatase [Cyanobacteria bacterium UBA11366]HBK62230.1 alkaline phosphatase [Cyanobacteria bacterium UBA11166]HBR74317.1 alkaline phosphatase [Cyanobacteria bacterium UBA11159]HBS68533.1 alkaline phosphatase [Cyanobacteria bacterium UBA11153]HBW87364.1 alkaline phosphatase [Cyanobacteria bacterium UBA11149]HCA94441.1 alkaline phosphatase [Cyanobacteria bacterium UBA9226]